MSRRASDLCSLFVSIIYLWVLTPSAGKHYQVIHVTVCVFKLSVCVVCIFECIKADIPFLVSELNSDLQFVNVLALVEARKKKHCH